MAKLIPGKLRMEGVELYETGQIEIFKEQDHRIYARVAEEEIRYSLDDDLIFCACDFFKKRGYCVHLAALEYYLKNDQLGQQILLNLEANQEEKETVETQVTFGGEFLKSIQVPRQSNIYRLSAQGQVEAGTNRIIWTLRIGLSQQDKFYVIRDIPLFLKIIEFAKPYMIGKYYESSLKLEQFDKASQEVLNFLLGLVEEKIDYNIFFQNQGRHLYFPKTFFEQGASLLMGLVAFQFDHQLSSYPHLLFQDFDGQASLFSFRIEEKSNYFEMEIFEQAGLNFFYRGQVLFYKGNFFLTTKKQASLLDALRKVPLDNGGRKILQFDTRDRDLLASTLSQFKCLGKVEAPDSLQIQSFRPSFYMEREEDGSIRLDMQFQYETCLVTNRNELENLPFASDIQLEKQIFQLALSAGFEADFRSWRQSLKAEAVHAFFQEVLPAFAALGELKISESMQDLYQIQKPQVQISSKGSLLEIQFDFQDIDQEEINRAMKALVAKQDYYISSSDQVYYFDEQTKRIRQDLEDLGIDEIESATFQARKSLAYTLSHLFKDQDQVTFTDEFRHLAHHLTHPEDFPMKSLDIRAIAFLSSQFQENSRVLILAPSGLIYNWADEFEKFAPDIDVAVVHGLKPYRETVLAENHQIYLTSYATFRQDSDVYKQMSFDFLFLDEAQVMKNAQTKIAKILRKFVVPSVFALSGTPIENNLGELWSIFQIVLPGLLPAKKDFMKLSADRVAQFIKPFVMRRKKGDVLTELPDLIEVVYKNELEDEQKAIYLAQLQQMQERLGQVTESEFQRNRVEILTGLMRLRQICDTPTLFMDDYKGDSGKLDSLRGLLSQIAEGNHRVLIFSQFRGMLDQIEEELPQLGLTSFKITGSTPSQERQEMTKAFNQGERDVFLISLKAGGVGLNLTGADTVILVDLWWNPAVESQAIGRAHRMGQEQAVEVYRLVTRGTIEEKIQELQEQKKNLVSEVLDGTESRGSLTLTEIQEILGISGAKT